MHCFTVSLASLLSLGCLTTAQSRHSQHSTRANGSSIQWTDCILGTAQQAECGTMSVPLDYTDEQSPETTIQILRVPAAKEPRKGSIFVNFGGPGLSGHSELGASAQVMLG